ncbi:MAG TPA: hypothetical protein VK083_04930 [Nocardia sp.]|uniref:hypothetical protein n=1 Tax=Nocardia TaxID=1817 RepID=UPI00245435AE|nr:MULTISPECIES: hypothetical protein [Nocardia]HLS76119.1 hypothetical protein [Nocardia sp.]
MIGKFEANKDLIQELTSSGARHVGNIATIITATVAEVTREIGEWITDAVEMREAAEAARRDTEQSAAPERTAAPVAEGFDAPAEAFDADLFTAEPIDAEIVDRDPAGPEAGDRR